MILPLFLPFTTGGVVRESVSVISNYRKSGPYVAAPQRFLGIRKMGNGPAGIRTQDQGIRVAPPFPAGADYLFTRGQSAGRGAGRSRLSSRALEALR